MINKDINTVASKTDFSIIIRNDDDGFGILSTYANPKLIPMESNAWELVAIKKHTERIDAYEW